jgi:sugar phosphate isomerase/epimerase
MVSALSRRQFLQTASALGVLPLSACASQEDEQVGASTKPGPFFAGHNLPIGIQLYTLADMLKADPDGTIAAVARMGYQTVEIPSYMGKTPAQLRAAFDANGLTCTAAHVGLRAGTAEEPGLTGNLGKLAADMHVLGVSHVIAPAMAIPDDIKLEPIPGEGYGLIVRVAAAMTPDHWKRMAAQLNDIGRKLKADGIAFGYHNHNFEFAPSGGKTGLDILIAESDPEQLTFELDVGWTAAAGIDPAEMFGRYPGRFGLMHVKDIQPSTQPNIALKMDPTEVGSGRLNWKTLLPAAYAAGVRKFFLEQEPPFVKPRLEAAQIGYDYLRKLET